MKRKIYDKLLEWKQVPQFPFYPLRDTHWWCEGRRRNPFPPAVYDAVGVISWDKIVTALQNEKFTLQSRKHLLWVSPNISWFTWCLCHSKRSEESVNASRTVRFCFNNGITILSGVIYRVPIFYINGSKVLTAWKRKLVNACRGIGNGDSCKLRTIAECTFWNLFHSIVPVIVIDIFGNNNVSGVIYWRSLKLPWQSERTC